MRIERNCTTCGKQLQVTSDKVVGTWEISELSCGHKLIKVLNKAELRERARQINTPLADIRDASSIAIAEEPINPTQSEVASTIEQIERFEAADSLLESLIDDDQPWNWQNLMPFQREGVLFGEGSGIRLLIADEPALGKTVQAIVLVDRNFEACTPLLIICPSSITTHWERFLKKWLQKDKYNQDKPHRTINIHRGRNVPVMDGFAITIVANNLISGEHALASIIENAYKCVIIDECHHFKSDKAERTKAMIAIAGSIEHIIALSGTPIMNRVDEYFPILHILRPEQWPSRMTLNNICEKDAIGRSLQILPAYRPWFFERIKNYVIRRKRSEHLPGLPAFTRIQEFLNPESLNPKSAKQFAQSYNFLTEELETALADNDHGNIIGILSRIRRITGEAKAQSAVEYAIDLLDSDEDGKEKLIIGVHHKNTATILKHFLTKISIERNDPTLVPLEMGSGDATYKDSVMRQFAKPEHRICICSIIACAEGLDGLQNMCSRSLIIEREWNAEKERQFEDRLNRMGQTMPVQAIYYMMLSTIDEWLHELVELKRQIVGATFDANFEVNPDIMRELARKVVQNRMKIIGV